MILPEYVDDLPLAVVLRQVHVVDAPEGRCLRARGLIQDLVDHNLFRRGRKRTLSVLVPGAGEVEQLLVRHWPARESGLALLSVVAALREIRVHAAGDAI